MRVLMMCQQDCRKRSLASTKQALADSEEANVQWTDYANGLTGEKTALEAEVAALNEQSTASKAQHADGVVVDPS